MIEFESGIHNSSSLFEYAHLGLMGTLRKATYLSGL